MQLDELKYLILGQDYKINDKIIVHNPTIAEISEFGEFNYLALINYIVMRPYDDMVNLWDEGIDYETVSDFELFIRNVLSLGFTPKYSSILFGDLDFGTFTVGVNPQNEELIITNGEVVIDRNIYQQIVDYVRFINYIDSEIQNEIKPGSLATKKYLIKRMRRKQEFNAKKEPKQHIANLVSSLVNIPNTNYSYEGVMELHISQLYDSFYRVMKRDGSHYVKQAIYGGTINPKDIDNSVLEWFGSISKQNKDKEKER